MQTISINLSDSLGDFVRRQFAGQGIDKYFEKILYLQQREKARDKLEAELITPEYWQRT